MSTTTRRGLFGWIAGAVAALRATPAKAAPFITLPRGYARVIVPDKLKLSAEQERQFIDHANDALAREWLKQVHAAALHTNPFADS